MPKKHKKKIWGIIIAIIIIAVIAAFGFFEINSATKANEISREKAEEIVNSGFDKMAITPPLKLIAEKNDIKVNSITYGVEKDIILDCSVKTVNAYKAISPFYDKYLGSDVKKSNGTMFKSALDFKLEFEEEVTDLLNDAEDKKTECKIVLYETPNGIVIYSDEKTIDAVYGGTVKISKDIEDKKSFKNEIGEEKKITSNNVKKGFVECISPRYSVEKPDTSSFIGKSINKLKKTFYKNFISKGRWKTIFKGLWVTIKLTFFALIIGIFLGFIVAFVRCTYIKTTKHGIVLKILNAICQVYLTVIRGTPVVVQIMIIYFVIFMPLGVNKFFASVICFGFNSGAYVAEIVRGGIMSVDNGQTEAGRSLGFGYMNTMWYIVFPQAFKAVLPALANEFVVLLKETSIAFYIGLGDLMYSVNAIRAATYTAFMPLVAAAVIYLIMVLILSKLVSILERRLRNSER